MFRRPIHPLKFLNRTLTQNRERGFSLIEAMVAAGLVAVIGAGTTSLILNTNKQQKGIQAKDQQREVTANIRYYLTNQTACLNSIHSSSDGAGFAANKTNPPLDFKIIDSAGNVQIKPTDKDKTGLLTITSITVSDFAPTAGSAGQGTINLKVNLEKTDTTNTGNKNLAPDLVKLRVTYDTSTFAISACEAIGNSTDSLWVRSSANLNDIFYTAGNVGVGTASPTAKLEVAGDILIGGAGQIKQAGIAGSPGTPSSFLRQNTSQANSWIYQESVSGWGIYHYNTDDGTTAQNSIDITNGGAAGWDSAVFPSLPGSTKAAIVLSNLTGTGLFAGKIGIGTPTPTESLDVVGNIKMDAGSMLTWQTDAGGGAGDQAWIKYHFNEGGENSVLEISNQNDLEDRIRMIAGQFSLMPNAIGNGYVGVGTKTPASLFHMLGSTPAVSQKIQSNYSGSAASVVESQYISNGDALGFYVGKHRANDPSYPNFGYVWNYENGPIHFGTNGTEKMRINANGNVGIGIANPQGDLQIRDQSSLGSVIFLTGNTVNGEKGMRLHYNNDTSSASYNWSVIDTRGKAFAIRGVDTSVGGDVGAAADPRFFIDLTNGNVGISTITPQATLHVEGTGIITPSVVYSSDERLKQNLTPLEKAIDQLSNLRTVTFNWNEHAKSRGLTDKKDHLGLIAQDVEKHFPQAVVTNPDHYKSVDYAVMVVPLIAAIKEQKEINQKLLQKNKQLEDRLTRLEQNFKKDTK